MFGKVALFELRYQLRQPVFWVVAAVFFLITFGATTVDQIHVGGTAQVFKNSPYAIAQISLVWTVFFMFVTTAFVANVVVRDEETGFGQVWKRKDELLAALEEYRASHAYLFSTLLVTDVTTQNSLLLVVGDEKFIRRIDHPRLEPGVYELLDVVSRKKQLLPYLTHCLREREKGLGEVLTSRDRETLDRFEAARRDSHAAILHAYTSLYQVHAELLGLDAVKSGGPLPEEAGQGAAAKPIDRIVGKLREEADLLARAHARIRDTVDGGSGSGGAGESLQRTAESA